MVEHLPRGICAIYPVRFKLVTNGTVKVLSHNDVSVYLGRQRGDQKNEHEAFSFSCSCCPKCWSFPENP